MLITILSAFRNAEAYIPRYFDQMSALAREVNLRGHALSMVGVYGDSGDQTAAALHEEATQRGISAHLIEFNHGGKRFGSVVSAQRFRQLASVGQRLFANIPADADAVILVESDLIWDAATMLALVAHLWHYPAVAPMIMHADPEDAFYDVWAFRVNGHHFTRQPPYIPSSHQPQPPTGRVDAAFPTCMMRVDSAGSVLAIRGDIARRVTVPEENVIVGTCEQINRIGGSVWVDRSLCVRHP